ncbi:MAG: hypothetical protein ABIN74_14600 [Ferruginibacter sp.]
MAVFETIPFSEELSLLHSPAMKLDYIHNNPNAEHWKLCKEPADPIAIGYNYSSAKFYKTGIDDPIAIAFGFLKHTGEVICLLLIAVFMPGSCGEADREYF